jgi:hypothetical protein
MQHVTRTRAIGIALAAIAVAVAPLAVPAVAAPSVAPAAVRSASMSITTDGIFKVGKDIRYGTYLGVLRSGSSFGQYSRLKCKTDSTSCRLDWGFVGIGQQMVVTIKSKDAYFKTNGITWAPVASAPVYVMSTNQISTSGIDRVGKDMRAGTWQATVRQGVAGALGVYQRLKCVDTTQVQCTIDSQSVSGVQTIKVRILKTDKFFRTSGFGTWKRIGN